jgi:arylsulfatase A-like enzyme
MSLVKYRHLVHKLLPERLGNRLIEVATRVKNRVVFARRAGREIEGTVRRILPPGHGAHVVDPLIRVPLFIAGPLHLPRGRTCDRVVSQVDLAPTLLDLVGAPASLPGADGMSLLPLMRGQDMAPREVFFENAGSNAGLRRDEQLQATWIMGLRSDRYKFWYRRFNPEPYPELYDVTTDPAERNNLAASMPDRVAAMRDVVERLTPRDLDKPFIAAEELGPEETRLIEERLRGLGYLS